MQLNLEKTKSADRHKQAYETVVNNLEFRKWFEGSKIVDANGDPQVFYHGTVWNFERFDNTKSEGGMGVHFGALNQAVRICYHFDDLENPKTLNDDVPGEHGQPRFIPVFINCKQPIFIEGDPRFWNVVWRVIGLLLNNSNLSHEEKIYLEKHEEDINSPSTLKSILIKFGYDGIVYLNKHERRERKESSVLVFGDHQTWSLYANEPM